MALQLDNRIDMTLYVDGKEMPINGYMGVDYLHIGVTLLNKLPTMDLVLTDPYNVLGNVTMVRDATPIIVQFRINTDTQFTYAFRLFNHRRLPARFGATWFMSSYMDNPVWWASTTVQNYYGSSSDILKQIAGLCSIQFKGDPTADAQLWNQQGAIYADFAREIAATGYASDTSRMTMAYDLSNMLLYKDVSVPGSPVCTLFNGQITVAGLPISRYTAESTSGYSNKHIGYQSSFVRQSLIKPSTVTNLSFTPNVTEPNFNSKVKGTILNGTARHSYIDVGNSNDSTERGYFQNIRYGAMFNQKLHMEANIVPIPVKMLDWVDTSLTDEQTNLTDTLNSGRYLVTARAISVTGTHYTELLLGERHGVNGAENA